MRFNGAILGAAVGLVGRGCTAFAPALGSSRATARVSASTCGITCGQTCTNSIAPNLRSRIRRRRRALGEPLFHGPDEHHHGHDDHAHGHVQDAMAGFDVTPDGRGGGVGNGAIPLPVLGAVVNSSALVDRDPVVAADVGALMAHSQGEHGHVHLDSAEGDHDSEHGHGHGHSHGHGVGGHSHAHFHLDVGSLKTRPTLIRLFVATMCVLALPLWRRSSRLEWAALGGVSLFLAAVDMGKFAISRIRLQVGSLYSGWKAHADLASSTQQNGNAVTKESAREIDIITWVGALVNVGLAGFKFFAGIFGHSAAMIADAGHSLSDLLSDGVTLWAVRLSRLPPDDDHPYGHGRFESVGAFIIAVMLMGAGYSIGNHSFETLVELASGASQGVTPTRLTAVAATISIIAKEALFRATLGVGKRRKSQVLIANAWHHRTDAVSSVVALIAIVGSMCGAPMLDPIAGLMVAGMVSLTGVQVCADSMAQLTDATDYDVRRNVAGIARLVPGVLSFDRVRARRMGPKTLVDLTIQIDNKISASAAQQIGQRVRWKILEQMPQVADVLVNIAVEPKPCPVVSSLRLQEEIEQDIRSVVTTKLPEIFEVPKIMVHYINMVVTAEVFIRVDPNLRVKDAVDIARRAKYALSNGIDDLCSTEVHLDLVESYL